MAEDRSWMYTGRQSRKKFTPEWLEKTTEFVERAFRILPPGRPAIVMCPCARCRNRNRRPRTKYAMQLDLGRNGFMPGYTVWVHHGEGHDLQPAKPSDDHPGEENLDGKKDGAGGGEQVSKTQGTKEWEMPLLEAYARSKLPKEDQIKWSYQKYLWEQEKIKQQQSAPKRLRTSGSSTAKPAEDEERNVSVPEPELEDTATSTADGPVATPATRANVRGVQIPAGPTARPKRKTTTSFK